jgi:diguanylate cyclase (GGDEF)-like protein/PAS domain S-box-containing protein
MLCFAPPVRKVWKMHETGFWQKYKNSPGWLKASAFALVIIVAGLIWAVFSIHNQRREQVIKGVRDMQTVIIRESAGNAQAWYEQRVGMQGADPTVVLNEIFTGFVANNHIPGMSEVWMTTPNDVYLHRDKPFANGSLGMSFNELIAERDAAGGSHSENVLAGVRQGVKGSDWYIVDPQTGKEVVSWLPVWLGGQVYTIGLSAVESNVMAVAGVEEEFKRNFFFAIILSSLLCIVFYLLQREEGRSEAYSEQLEKTIREKSLELEFTNARYKTLVEQITAVTYVDANDIECTPIFMSPQMQTLFGYSDQEWRSNPSLWPDIVHPDDRERVVAEHERTFNTGEPFNMDYRVYTKCGKVIWIHDESVLAVDPNGMETWQGVMYDISDRKAMEDELRYLGHHDSLTGLYSRAFMETELERLQKSRDFPVSIIMSDVDKLKTVNDKFGHAVGDEMLRRAASVIRSAFRAEDIIARMGGDEFAVVLPATDAKAAQQAVDRIQKAIAKEAKAGIGPKLKISLGCATGAQNDSLEQVLRRADRNMYQQKQSAYAGDDLE